MLVFDPKSTKEEVAAFFPGVHQSYYYELHELLEPKEETVPERDAFGTHWAQVAAKMLRS